MSAISRRHFLAKSAAFSLVTLSMSPARLLADSFSRRFGRRRDLPGTDPTLSQVDPTQNLFMAFNNIRNCEDGESDEFTTMANLDRILKEMNVASGATVIGIGARTGTPGDIYGVPGEMGYLWKLGEPWNGMVTAPDDARPIPLEKDDPIAVTQVGVLHEESAVRFTYDEASLAGTVLWTFYNDDTTKPIIDQGMHNSFSDLDGGMTDLIFQTSKKALTNPLWASQATRGKLEKFIPNLKDDNIWKNFSGSLRSPVVHEQWLKTIRQKGWAGAAVVLKGSMMNVAQFHLRQWNRTSPKEPIVQIGQGTHGDLNLLYGRELRPYITQPTGDWTMVGFIWDLKSATTSPVMTDYQKFSDIFGQDFHIHGFKNDGSIGGHTLFSMMGEGKLEVALYPLSFSANKTGFMFNNDLQFVKDSVRQSGNQVSVQIKNHGQNFLRKVGIQLSIVSGSSKTPEFLMIPVLAPGEVQEITFSGAVAQATQSTREIVLDRDGRLLEGGLGTSNNRLQF